MDRRDQINSRLGNMAEERRDLENELQGLPPNLPDLDVPPTKATVVIVDVPKFAPLALPNNKATKKGKKKK